MPSPVMPGPVMPGPVIRQRGHLRLGLTWSLRLIGLCRSSYLHALLTPEDFGVIALAAAVMALVDTFSNIGLYQALLRTPDPTRAHYEYGLDHPPDADDRSRRG